VFVFVSGGSSSEESSTCISSSDNGSVCEKGKDPSNANAAGIPPPGVDCGSSVYDSTSTRHKGHVGD
jgi:hypothetical protein